MTRTKSRKFTLTGAASLLALSLASGAYAQETEFDIEAQPLAKALLDFNEQSGLTVAAPRELVADKRSPAVQGEMEPEEALEKILFGSGLKSDELPTGAYTITLASAEVTEPAPQPFRVAQLDEEDDIRGVDVRTNDDAERREDVIVVTGTSIRGIVPESAPLVSYTADDIARSGATTIERFLETLPQNSNSQTPLGSTFGPGSGDRGSTGIDLRGLGIGTTLVLLNGRRLTQPGGGSPDVSLIPVSAIERVEVLSDGASAIYGSDAIGGVVNIVLRESLEGAETALSYGTVTSGSHDRFQATQSFGKDWESGRGLISYTYSDQSALDSSDRSFAITPSPTTLVPDDEKHRLFATITQSLSEKITVSSDFFYSTADTNTALGFLSSGGTETFSIRDITQEQFFVSGAIDYQFSDELFFELQATYVDIERESVLADLANPSVVTRDGTSLDLLAKVDGSLFSIPAGEVKFAAGGGYSEQKSVSPPFRRSVDLVEFSRNSYFVFGEVFVPIVGESQNISGINRLELNAAFRTTDYSDFGSSTTPRVGLLWSPFEGLNVRSTYARGFRAPTLSSTGATGGFAQVVDLAAFGFPDTFSDDNSSVLLLAGGSRFSGLTPEFSDTYTIGADFTPISVPNLRVSTTYFSIDYTDRLGAPDPSGGFGAVIDQPGNIDLFNTNPTQADIELAIEAVDSVDDFTGTLMDPNDPVELAGFVTVILDNRSTNLAQAKTEGIDFSISYSHESPVGELNYGGNVTYTIDSFQKLTPTSDEISLLDTVGNPTSLKLSSYIGVRNGGFSGQLNANYIDSYEDVFQSPEQPIESWTTFDLNLSYSFGEDRADLLKDLQLSATVNNLLDNDPPDLNAASVPGGGLRFPVGYDPVNANPIGRFVTFGIRKRF